MDERNKWKNRKKEGIKKERQEGRKENREEGRKIDGGRERERQKERKC